MNKSPKQLIREYFDFNRNDRNAIITLLISILMVSGAHFIIDDIDFGANVDNSGFRRAMEKWNVDSIEYEIPLRLFEFDPNLITEQRLDSLLLPAFVKKNLLSYRSAGGRFLGVDDFKKLYGMNDSIFQAVKMFIVFRKKISQGERLSEKDDQYIPVRTRTSENIIEINRADSTELISLRGIGPVFALRIIRYRDLLGGFHNKEQLLEVYNFPQETFENIRQYISVDTCYLNKLRINFAGYTNFLRHPYIDKEEVENILNYRSKNGSFKSTDILFTAGLVDTCKIDRLLPYLTCE